MAGIIGGRKPEDGDSYTGPTYADGMCPDIQLYDFRVLAKTLEDTEFAIIAALQYIRYVNERHSYVTIHGANDAPALRAAGPPRAPVPCPRPRRDTPR